MTKEILIENMQTVTNNYRGIIEDLVKKHMPEGWTVTALGWSHFKIGFISGKWKNGSPQYTELDFYVGPDCKYDFKTKKTSNFFRFEINPFTAGSFDPENEDSYVRTYFKGVGVLLNDDVFEKTLRDLIIKYHTEYNNYKTELDKIHREEVRIRREEEQKAREAEELADFITKKDAIEANDEADTYLVIRKDCGGKFIYRKAPVKVMTNPVSWRDAHQAMNELKRTSYGKFQVIETEKIKFTA